jgi:hypothetical protein
MGNENTLGALAIHFGKIVSPMYDAFSDEISFKSFVYRLGWNAESLPPEYVSVLNEIGGLKEKLDILVADTSIENTVVFITSLRSVIESVSSLTEAPPGIELPDKDAFIDSMKGIFTSILFTDYLQREFPELYKLGRLLGVIESVTVPAIGSRQAFQDFRIHLDRIPAIIKNPLLLPRIVYGWNTPAFKFNLLAEHLDQLFSAIHIPSYTEPEDGAALLSLNAAAKFSSSQKLTVPVTLGYIDGVPVRFAIEISKWPALGASPAGLAILLHLPAELVKVFEFSSDFSLSLSAANDANTVAGIIATPDTIQLITPSADDPLPFAGNIGISLVYKPETNSFLIGTGEGSNLQLQEAALDFRMSDSGRGMEILIGMHLREMKFVLSAGSGDGFIQRITAGKSINGQFSLDIIWSNLSGVNFSTDGAISFNIPCHIDLGIFEIMGMNISMGAVDERLKGIVTGNIKTRLGPLTAIVNNIGLAGEFSFPSSNSGNLGPLDLAVKFQPPTGLGLLVEGGGLRGGGILNFDPDKAEYFGAIELEYRDMFSLKAFGIINTRMPDGSKGFSLLIIITAEFTPIQLGFGFTLIGVGGLLGLHRTVRLDVLKEGIRTNAIKSILFPEDVVTNISRIVSDVKAVFPVQEDHFVVCPMGKLGWGTPAIITLELGILVEIPVAGFAILGVLKALLPEEESALLRLQINFIGIADFDNRSFSLDGTLYDSRILVYTLTGDMAFRLSYGDHPVFVLSVGGFHPAFREAPADLQHMERLTISLYNSESAWIKVETYFAVTSNTAQFGARAELFAGSATGFNIYGFLGYDVLFQFEPFRFVADFSAGFALRRRSSVIMGVTASGELSGPSPWDAHGKASVSFFFFSVSVSFHKTWGENVVSPEPGVADLTELLRLAIADDRNWNASIPANNKLYVSIREIVSPHAVVHPFGLLTFSERLLPLEVTVEKFGNKRAGTENRFKIRGGEGLTTEEVREPFAPANFFNLSDSDKLSRPSYETMLSGFRITGSAQLVLPVPVACPVDYELSYLEKKRTKLKKGGLYGLRSGVLKGARKGGSSSGSKLSVINNRVSVNAPQQVEVTAERYAIASTGDMTLYRNNLIAGTYTEALDRYNRIIATEPELADQLQIVADYELNTF